MSSIIQIKGDDVISSVESFENNSVQSLVFRVTQDTVLPTTFMSENTYSSMEGKSTSLVYIGNDDAVSEDSGTNADLESNQDAKSENSETESDIKVDESSETESDVKSSGDDEMSDDKSTLKPALKRYSSVSKSVTFCEEEETFEPFSLEEDTEEETEDVPYFRVSAPVDFLDGLLSLEESSAPKISNGEEEFETDLDLQEINKQNSEENAKEPEVFENSVSEQVDTNVKSFENIRTSQEIQLQYRSNEELDTVPEELSTVPEELGTVLEEVPHFTVSGGFSSVMSDETDSLVSTNTVINIPKPTFMLNDEPLIITDCQTEDSSNGSSKEVEMIENDSDGPTEPVAVMLSATADTIVTSDDEATIHVIKKSYSSIEFKGEVDSDSILVNKEKTKVYWEEKMTTSAKAATEETGWESVANVCFRDPNTGITTEIEPPVKEEEVKVEVVKVEGFLPAPPPQFDNSPPHSLEQKEEDDVEPEIVDVMEADNKKVTKRRSLQYVYGEEGDGTTDNRHNRMRQIIPNPIPTVKESLSPSQGKENVIEAEIREQQERERELHQQQINKQQLLKQEQREKGASSPQDSDEGFVDPTPKKTAENNADANRREVCESPLPLKRGSAKNPTAPSAQTVIVTGKSTETKIALEIRELKEREEELKRQRRRRVDSFLEEDIEERSSSCSSRGDDNQLVSLITTTDEGNYSECGDNTSGEDKSSTSSNSRITSPEIPPVVDYPRPPRRVSVKPFMEEEVEEVPLYNRMKNESVIEREIRLSKERDEAFKKEKGLQSRSSDSSSITPPTTKERTTAHAPVRLTHSNGRDSPHHQATARIQREIEVNGEKEREMVREEKKQDTVDEKVSRMCDVTDSTSSSSHSSSSSRSSSRQSSSPHSTLSSRSTFSPFGGRATTNGYLGGSNLTKSLSTTNLSTIPTSLSGAMRTPRGFMEKFIASKGKMTPSAFGGSTGGGKVVITRPMKLQPKTPVVLRQQTLESKLSLPLSSSSPTPTPRTYKKLIGAEEKIQEELKEMKKREEELRMHRSRHLAARSQPNLLAAIGLTEEINIEEEEKEEEEGVKMRGASSDPNLLEEGEENVTRHTKAHRRRSTLIAQWENRIQATSAIEA